MKSLLQLFCFLLTTQLLLVSCAEKDSYRPDRWLDPKEQQELMWSVIRYLGRAPQGASPTERFYSQYDSFYMDQLASHRLEAYYPSNGKQYFLISRSAPSLSEKRVATGGWLVRNSGGDLTDYREVFRTWKMVPDTLSRRAVFLFDKMVNGESLEDWETRNSGGIEYIEFPDERTTFDSASRSWLIKTAPSDSLK